MVIRERVATIMWKDGFGGAERSLSDFAAGLDKTRFDIRFYYLSGDPGYFGKQIAELGFDTIYLNWKSGFDISGTMFLLKKLKEFNPHIIHDHILPPLTRLFLKVFLHRPIVNTEHGRALIRAQGIGEPWRKIIEKFEFMLCNVILANSHASAQALKSVYRISTSKIKVVHLGINLNHFNPVSINKKTKGPLTLGYVGRIINEHKGVDYLPQVTKSLLRRYNVPFKVMVAGDGPDRAKTEQLCRDMGVDEYFTFLGWVADVKRFLQDIDVLLVPSRFEPLGLTAIEALAMNVPVVAYDVQGLHEILNDCESGILVSPGNTTAMADAVYSLSKDFPKLGSAGREFVLKYFSNHKMARQYGMYYRALLEKF